MKIIFMIISFLNHAYAQKPNQCTVYPIGNDRPNVQKIENLGTIACSSPDGEWVVRREQQEFEYLTTSVVNMKTGQKLELGDVRWCNFSPNGDLVLSNGRKTIIEDLKSGTQKEILELKTTTGSSMSSAAFNKVQLFADGKSAIAWNDYAFYWLDVENGRAKELDYYRSNKNVIPQVSPDGKVAFVANYGATPRLISMNGTEEKFSGPEWANWQDNAATFSPDGKTLARSNGKEVRLVDLKTKKIISTVPVLADDLRFTPDGKKMFYSNHSTDSEGFIVNFRAVHIVDLETKKNIENVAICDDPLSKTHFLSDQNTASFNGSIYNFKTDERDSISGNSIVHTVELGKELKALDFHGNISYYSLDKTCVSPARLAAGCAQKPLIPDVFKQSREKILCSYPYHEKMKGQWDILIGNERDPLSEQALRGSLLRFQKPGGFNPKSDLPVLLAALKSPLMTHEPDLILAAMHNVYLTSNKLYERLLRDFPRLSQLRPTAKFAPCRTADEEKKIEAGALKYWKNIKDKRFIYWQNLMPFASVFKSFTPAKKEEMHDEIAQKLADRAADSEEFSGVFLSKLYKFTSEATAPIFGGKSKPMSDLTLVRNGNHLQPIILGGEAINGGKKTDYGFYAKKLPPVQIPKDSKPGQLLKNETVTWVQGGQQYQAEYSARVMKTSIKKDTSTSPDYEALWKDGALNGLVVTGSNLSVSSADVLHTYAWYYQKQGFKFDPELKEIPNFQKYLREQVESGKTDYFIKEAHSDGDEKNLFLMDQTVKLRTGTRKLPNGKIETITLVYPDKKNKVSKHVSNQDFGEWIRNREKNKQGQFVYLNSSCWSHTKALYEIEAARSPVLVEIPTLTTMEMFSAANTNVEKIFLDEFRSGKTYLQMREKMKLNSGYKNRNDDVFIFPDEEAYDSKIWSAIQTPLDLKVSLKRNGKAYSIDQE